MDDIHDNQNVSCLPATFNLANPYIDCMLHVAHLLEFANAHCDVRAATLESKHQRCL